MKKEVDNFGFVPFGYRNLTKYFLSRARNDKQLDQIAAADQETYDHEVSKYSKQAEKGVKINNVASQVLCSPVLLVMGGIVIIGAVAGSPVTTPAVATLLITSWAGSAGGAAYSLRSATRGMALEEKRQQCLPPPPKGRPGNDMA